MKDKKEKEEVKEEEKVVEESEAVKAFRATWELFKVKNPKKYEEKIANGEFETQLKLLREKEEEDARIALVLSKRTTLSENPKK